MHLIWTAMLLYFGYVIGTIVVGVVLTILAIIAFIAFIALSK